MKINKILALTTAITMIYGALTGCGDSDDDDRDRSSGKKWGNLFGGRDASSEASSRKDRSSEKDEAEDNQKPDEEPDEMEFYDTAMQMLDTWLTGRMDGDQAKAESVLYPDEEWRFGYEYSPIDGFYDYDVIQFLVTDISKDIDDFVEENDDDLPYGLKIQNGFQLNSQIIIYGNDGSSDWGTCTDCILKINGKWYFYPDTLFRDIESEDIGFSYSPLRVDSAGGSSYYDSDTGRYIHENFYELTDGTKISEEEYKNSIITVYGYYVEKYSDGTFSFHQISEDGSFTFDDGRTAKVDRAEVLYDQEDYTENTNEQETTNDISTWSDDEIVNAVNTYLEENWIGEYQHYCFTSDLSNFHGYLWLMIRWNGGHEANVDSGSSIRIDTTTGDAEISYLGEPYEWFNLNDYYVG